MINEKVSDSINKGITVLMWISGIFFLIGTIVTFTNVIFRKLFDRSWTGMEDFNAIMLMTLIYLPLVYLEWNGKQLNLSFFIDKFNPKVQIIIKKIEHVIILFISLIIFMGGWEIAYTNWQMGTQFASLQIPLFIPYSVMVFSFGIISIVKLLQLFMPERIGGNHVD